MAASDASALPTKGSAFRWTTEIRDSLNNFITSGTVTATISKDGGTFAATTNSPVAVLEVGGSTNSGTWYVELTGTEMDAYTVVLRMSSTAADAKVAQEIIITESNGIRSRLTSSGLDAVTVESGMNARQSLSICTSALAGVLAGADTTSVTIAAAGVPATNRITSVVDANGNRTSVTLNPPA